MAVCVVPAFVRAGALQPGFYLGFFTVFLHTVQVPDVVVDPFGVRFCLGGNIDGGERLVGVAAVKDKENVGYRYFAAA